MHALILINYAVFASFLTVFLIEFGIALLLLISYNSKDKLMKYLMPMWEIDGTFAVFYVVDLEATYPNILPAVGTIYILPVLLAALFFIFRNAFLAYSEYTGRDATKRSYIMVYSIATIIVAFLALAVLSSSVSGIGVNLVMHSLYITKLLLNPFSLIIFTLAVLLSLFITMVTFDIGRTYAEILCAVIAVIIAFAAIYVYPHYMVSNIFSNAALLAVPVLLIAAAILLHAIKSKTAKYFAILALFSGVLTFELAEYPYLFKGAINLNSIVVGSPSASYLLAFSIGGIAVLAVLIGVLIYVNLRLNGDGGGYAPKRPEAQQDNVQPGVQHE